MMDLSVWGPVLTGIAMLVLALLTFNRGGRHDTESEAMARAKMSADISYIRMSVDDIKAENKITRQDLKNLEGRTAKNEAAIEALHSRMDDHINGGREET